MTSDEAKKKDCHKKTWFQVEVNGNLLFAKCNADECMAWVYDTVQDFFKAKDGDKTASGDCIFVRRSTLKERS